MSQKIARMSKKNSSNEQKKIVQMSKQNSSNELNFFCSLELLNASFELFYLNIFFGHLIYFHVHGEIFLDHLNYFVMIA